MVLENDWDFPLPGLPNADWQTRQCGGAKVDKGVVIDVAVSNDDNIGVKDHGILEKYHVLREQMGRM